MRGVIRGEVGPSLGAGVREGGIQVGEGIQLRAGIQSEGHFR